MIRKIAAAIGLIGGALALWLLAAPVAVDPVAWDAPANPGYTGPFAENDRLAGLRRIGLPDGYSGPEDAAFGPDGRLYMTSHEGAILALEPESGTVSVFAETGGRPLGLEFGPDGTLYVADAYRGLMSVAASGETAVLADRAADGTAILYADDLDVASDGTVYFSDASQKFGAKANGGTLPASILDLVEHGGHGRILRYDPETGKATTIADGLQFANGVALTPDESALLIVETGTYSVLRHDIGIGDAEVIVSNLPGFPDNINRNADGTFFFGLVSPRNVIMDRLDGSPLVRKMVMRLPAFMKPKPTRHGFVIRIDEDGRIIETLQDSSGTYALTTGAIGGPDGALYVTSLTEPDLGVIDP